ncbi:hypothetical protein ElyMa_004393900 [Elysia marginata]|uniref:Uncharacterized protein n=1 Tax=Elysia marginata TaxID=1093978 RepID=A0AAV4HBI4_9GAST|nr:hypothetical protein ElyMa_004393900 [Elysia marginata]
MISTKLTSPQVALVGHRDQMVASVFGSALYACSFTSVNGCECIRMSVYFTALPLPLSNLKTANAFGSYHGNVFGCPAFEPDGQSRSRLKQRSPNALRREKNQIKQNKKSRKKQCNA